MPAAPPPFVSFTSPDLWVVRNGGPLARELRRLGFSRWLIGPWEARFRPALSFEAMGLLATQLRDLGLAFSSGRDWSPSETVADLRDRGHLTGVFTEIAWGEKGEWRLRVVGSSSA